MGLYLLNKPKNELVELHKTNCWGAVEENPNYFEIINEIAYSSQKNRKNRPKVF